MLQIEYLYYPCAWFGWLDHWYAESVCSIASSVTQLAKLQCQICHPHNQHFHTLPSTYKALYQAKVGCWYQITAPILKYYAKSDEEQVINQCKATSFSTFFPPLHLEAVRSKKERDYEPFLPNEPKLMF